MRDIVTRAEAVVAGAVAAHALWPAGATVVVAVSGGADSLCLLGALLALREHEHPLAPGRLVVAHLDHGLRGKAGAEDARWVAAFSAGLGLECFTDHADVRATARAEHRSLEDAARRVRYAFLHRVARDTEAAQICTGHTRDDQAETIVMHWLRGSGLAGLSGMAPICDDLARPLLDLTRADTVAYCAARHWQPREDATNANTTFLRNRIRHELLPELERYNPNLRDTLLRNAVLIAEDDRYLEELAGAAWTEAVTQKDPNAITFSLAALARMPLALRRRVLRRMESALLADPGRLEARHIIAIERLLLAGRSGDSLSLPGGLRITRGYAELTCEAHATGSRPTTAGTELTPVPLSIPGMLDLPTLGWRLHARIVPGPLDAATLRVPSTPLADPATGAILPNPRAYLDADAAGDELFVRTWRRGDRLQPLGMSQDKKLQDLFTEAKIPRSLRGRLPLVAGPHHLVWVAGLRIDERARVRPATQRVLVLDLDSLVS